MVQQMILLLLPAALLVLCRKIKWMNWVGPVVWSYVLGICWANIPGLPLDTGAARQLTDLSVPLAIPLLLFSANLGGWLKTARNTLISFGLCIGSVLIMAAFSSWIYRDALAESWKLAGMAVGVYTGGTPNMNAIGLSLGISEEIFLLMNTADMVWGGLYFLFLITVAQRLLLYLLPAFLPKSDNPVNTPAEPAGPRLTLGSKLKAIVAALGIAFAILAAGAGLSFLVAGKILPLIVILTVTSLGILGSLIGRIKRNPYTFQTGEYILLVFCLSIGAQANIGELLQSSTQIFEFVGLVMFGSIAIHILLAAFYRIDADTVLITSAAAVFGPAFVGPVATALNNRSLIVAGMTTASIGYAIANYLGLAFASLF